MEQETRYQRLAREQAERQAKRAKFIKKGGFTNGLWRLDEHSTAKRTRKARHEETYEDRLDDLGESPDY